MKEIEKNVKCEIQKQWYSQLNKNRSNLKNQDFAAPKKMLPKIAAFSYVDLLPATLLHVKSAKKKTLKTS